MSAILARGSAHVPPSVMLLDARECPNRPRREVLSGRGYVSADAIRRVSRAVDATGYVPNDIARSLQASSTRLVGVVIDDLRQVFFAEVAAGIESILRMHGFRVFLAVTDGISKQEAEALEVSLPCEWKGSSSRPLRRSRPPASETRLRAVFASSKWTAVQPAVRATECCWRTSGVAISRLAT